MEISPSTQTSAVLGFDDLANVGDEQADGPDAAGGNGSLEGEAELGRGGVAKGT